MPSWLKRRTFEAQLLVVADVKRAFKKERLRLRGEEEVAHQCNDPALSMTDKNLLVFLGVRRLHRKKV